MPVRIGTASLHQEVLVPEDLDPIRSRLGFYEERLDNVIDEINRLLSRVQRLETPLLPMGSNPEPPYGQFLPKGPASLLDAEYYRRPWEATAQQESRNAAYYRGLVVEIGKLLGVEAYTTDAGTMTEDVLCAKVPELVRKRLVGDCQRIRELYHRLVELCPGKDNDPDRKETKHDTTVSPTSIDGGPHGPVTTS